MQLARITLHTIVATALWSTTSIAAPVELKSPDGLLSFEGEILDFNGFMLTVQTGHGVVNIPANAVQCFGESCPDGVEKGVAAATDVYEFLKDVNQDTADAGSNSAGQSGEFVEFGVSFSRPENKALLNNLLTSDGLVAAGLTASYEDDKKVSVSRADGTDLVALTLLDGSANTEVTIQTQVASAAANGNGQSSRTWAAPNSATDQQLKVEALAVVVSSAAGVDSISMEDLARIYSGEITNWSAFGGNDIPILAMQTGSSHPGHQSLRDAVVAPFGKTVSNMVLTVPDDAAMLSTLGIAPGGLAVVSADALGDTTPVSILDSCQNPTLPTEFNIASGGYPLTISTFANVASNFSSGAVGELLDELVKSNSPEILGSEVARTDRMNAVLQGTIPDELRSSARDFVQSVFSADRLAMTFQDGPVSDVVAARSRADFVRLSHAIANGDYDDQEIMFLGFTADGTNPGNSVAQSEEAAQSMLNAFRNFAPEAASRESVNFLTAGHGSVGYTECSASVGPAPVFVEVWVRPKA